MVGIFT